MPDRTRPLEGEDLVGDLYRTRTLAEVAAHAPLAIGLFLAAIGVASGLEALYHPERATALAIAYASYVGAAVVQAALLRWRPTRSTTITTLVTNWQLLSASTYAGLTAGTTGILLPTLLLYVPGLAVLYPWGWRWQLVGSLGAPIGYVLAVLLGAAPLLPLPLEALAVCSAVALGVLGAYALSRQRVSAFEHEKLTEALLETARALAAVLNDPRAVAAQLIEHTRRAMRADWAFLYERDWEAPTFHATAFSQLPDRFLEELRTLAFSPERAPTLQRRLREDPTVVVSVRDTGWPVLHHLLVTWQVDSIVFQSIRREHDVIGVLCCVYTTRRPVSPFERTLLNGIADQAVVALQNARAMEETRRSNALKSQFLTMMSHELRTPLNVIIGYTDLLLESRDDPAAPGDLADTLRRIRDRGIELSSLIEGMLTLEWLEARRLPVKMESFRLGDLIGDLRRTVADARAPGQTALHWRIDGADTVVSTDRLKLEIILSNLVRNALKYAPEGHVTVSVEVDPAAHRVEFAVTDTGRGIPSTEQALIFEMFQRGSNATATDGLGLGLHIVKRLTEALGGRVSVESVEGSGARFSVSLPTETSAERFL